VLLHVALLPVFPVVLVSRHFPISLVPDSRLANGSPVVVVQLEVQTALYFQLVVVVVAVKMVVVGCFPFEKPLGAILPPWAKPW
jgi:hypothetical protein